MAPGQGRRARQKAQAGRWQARGFLLRAGADRFSFEVFLFQPRRCRYGELIVTGCVVEGYPARLFRCSGTATALISRNRIHARDAFGKCQSLLSSCPGTVWSLSTRQFVGLPSPTSKISAGVPLKPFARFKMKKYLWIFPCAWLAIPVVCAGRSVRPKPVSKKSSSGSAKAASSAPKPAEPSSKIAYVDLSINEL